MSWVYTVYLLLLGGFKGTILGVRPFLYENTAWTGVFIWHQPKQCTLKTVISRKKPWKLEYICVVLIPPKRFVPFHGPPDLEKKMMIFFHLKTTRGWNLEPWSCHPPGHRDQTPVSIASPEVPWFPISRDPSSRPQGQRGELKGGPIIP